MSELELKNPVKVGKNESYVFAVAQLENDRWIGFAKGGGMIFLFAEISDGFELGILDRDRAILLTGAIAQDPEGSYGGIKEWLVAEELRGDPEKFLCDQCGRVGCQGRCDGDDWSDGGPY